MPQAGSESHSLAFLRHQLGRLKGTKFRDFMTARYRKATNSGVIQFQEFCVREARMISPANMGITGPQLQTPKGPPVDCFLLRLGRGTFASQFLCHRLHGDREVIGLYASLRLHQLTVRRASSRRHSAVLRAVPFDEGTPQYCALCLLMKALRSTARCAFHHAGVKSHCLAPVVYVRHSGPARQCQCQGASRASALQFN